MLTSKLPAFQRASVVGILAGLIAAASTQCGPAASQGGDGGGTWSGTSSSSSGSGTAGSSGTSSGSGTSSSGAGSGSRGGASGGSSTGSSGGGTTPDASTGGDDAGGSDDASIGDDGTGSAGDDGSAPAPCKPSGKSLKDSLLPVVKAGGFGMPGYFLWCSSVVLVDGTYHMFASRWPAAPGLNGWLTESEAVHATSTNLLGPYTFQEVVLQKRPGAWDSVRIHNVRITRVGAKFVLWYISNINDTGYAVADSVNGPWMRIDKPVATVSNPAPLIHPDLSVYLFGRYRDSTMVDRGIAFNAPTYDGTYTPVLNGANLLPNNYSIEDPTIWFADGQYNVLGTDIDAKATGTAKAGVQYSSTDGVSYKLVSKDLVFTKTVTYDDGTTETFTRRERPFVYVNESGEAIALFTAGLPASGPAHVLAQPVDRYCP